MFEKYSYFELWDTLYNPKFVRPDKPVPQPMPKPKPASISMPKPTPKPKSLSSVEPPPAPKVRPWDDPNICKKCKGCMSYRLGQWHDQGCTGESNPESAVKCSRYKPAYDPTPEEEESWPKGFLGPYGQ